MISNLETDIYSLVVEAKSDALIALDSDENDSDLYEIVIGGWGNSLSMVRRGKQGPNIGTGSVDKGSSPGQKGWTEVRPISITNSNDKIIIFRHLAFFLQVNSEASGSQQSMLIISWKSELARMVRVTPS